MFAVTNRAPHSGQRQGGFSLEAIASGKCSGLNALLGENES
jgi:hypothetical protein